MTKLPKNIKTAAKTAEAQGWKIDIRPNKVLFFPADKKHDPITVHLTASDWRAHKNFIAHLRRAGLDI